MRLLPCLWPRLEIAFQAGHFVFVHGIFKDAGFELETLNIAKPPAHKFISGETFMGDAVMLLTFMLSETVHPFASVTV